MSYYTKFKILVGRLLWEQKIAGSNPATPTDMDVPDGMVEVWTIERPTRTGVHIHDLKDTQEEAAAEIDKLGAPWTTTRLVVPYRKNQGS